MHPIPPIKNIPGFKVNVKPRDKNLAGDSGGQGAHLLENWYWRIDVTCDGSNPNWPEAFEETVYASRLRDTNEIPHVDSDIPTIILMADDSPIEIRTEERMIQNTLGLWLVVKCDTPVVLCEEGVQQHYMFIEELPAVTGMTMN